MELNHLQGKTVAEIEQQLQMRPTPKSGLKWFVIILTVVIIALGGTAWHQQRLLKQVQGQNNALQVENNALLVENETLQQKIEDLGQLPAPVSNTEQVFQDLPQNQHYIFYEVEPHDNLGKIATHFYGQADYAKQLAKINGLSLYTTLRVGQVVKVPKNIDDDNR